MRSVLSGLLVVVLVCGLSGCFFGGRAACEKPKEYQDSDSIEPLRVPDGLDQPDRSAGLVIPELSPDAEKREQDGPCLEEPPDYFGR